MMLLQEIATRHFHRATGSHLQSNKEHPWELVATAQYVILHDYEALLHDGWELAGLNLDEIEV